MTKMLSILAYRVQLIKVHPEDEEFDEIVDETAINEQNEELAWEILDEHGEYKADPNYKLDWEETYENISKEEYEEAGMTTPILREFEGEV